MARPPVSRSLHATNDKSLMDLRVQESDLRAIWPVYKGSSFDLWKPDTGIYYAWGDPELILPHLQRKRMRSGRNKRSPFSEFELGVLRDPEDPSLPEAARIAFRDVSNRTNQRTVIAALSSAKSSPCSSFGANYLLWPRGDCQRRSIRYWECALLASVWTGLHEGLLKRTSITFFVFNPFPVPRPSNVHQPPAAIAPLSLLVG